MCMCVCVCVSVTLWYYIKTAKRRITQIMPHNSPATLVFWCQRSWRISNGITPYGGDNCKSGRLKLATFDGNHTTVYYSKMVQDRHIISIKVEYKVICALSNGYVANDLGWPITRHTTHFCIFRRRFSALVCNYCYCHREVVNKRA